MKIQLKVLFTLFFCFLVVSMHGIYAVEENVQGKSAIELKVNYGGYYTASSWFKPYIIRNIHGGNYAWTVIGTVWFSKASKKPPGGYWESGAFPSYIDYLPLKTYTSGYISKTQLNLFAARIGSSPNNNSNLVLVQEIVIENNTIIKNEIIYYI